MCLHFQVHPETPMCGISMPDNQEKQGKIEKIKFKCYRFCYRSRMRRNGTLWAQETATAAVTGHWKTVTYRNKRNGWLLVALMGTNRNRYCALIAPTSSALTTSAQTLTRF